MGTNEKKMTTGSPGKLIITFAIPLMLRSEEHTSELQSR